MEENSKEIKLKQFERISSREANLDENTKSTKELLRKQTLNLDRKNFVNMKKNNLFDEYDICERLGGGAFGSVYKVRHKRLKLIRAVKAVKRVIVDENAFFNEMEILKNVDHPNIIRLYETFADNNYYYLVVEYCSGGDLYDYIKKQRSFSEKKAALILSQLISAVNHLHSKKIVHRDLKPENIVFIENNNKEDIFIKLIDFGTSTMLKSENLTQELGTIYYIAPEVFKNCYNEKCDMWSCGVILYIMLCGYPPFRGNNESTIKSKIINSNEVEFSSKEFKKVSKDAIALIRDLLTYDMNERLSASKVLNSVWIKKYCAESTEDHELDMDIVNNLTKFQVLFILID